MQKKLETKIVALFLSRSENAIYETKNLYGKLIRSVAYDILKNECDAEECENDTYLGLWESIPPAKPHNFKAYCLKVVRNLSLKKLEYYHAKKRNIKATLSYEQLIDEVGELGLANEVIIESQLSQYINDFLDELDGEKRKIFILRYWYMLSIKEITRECGLSESQIKSILFRTRKQLKQSLLEKGVLDGE